MKYGTLFSGIEGFGQGFDRSGMECAFQCEIDPQALDVLRYHYPDVPKWTDVTEVDPDELPSVDVLAFGSPCQDLSVAGRRAGLDGERSGLFVEAIRIADRIAPDWLVFENVPGLLSSQRGEDFAVVLEGITGFRPAVPEDGWRNSGFCIGPLRWAVWRMLDTQYFGPPQRRRRIFVVGCARGPCRPEVLLESEGVPWNPPPSREAREGAPGGTEAGAGGSGGVAFPLTAREGKGPASSVDSETFVAHTLRAQPQSSHRADSETFVAHTLRGEGFDASEDGTGRGTPLVLAFQPKASVTQSMGLTAECPTLGTTKTPAVIPFDTTQITSKANRTRAVPGRECHTLPASGDPPSIAYAIQERAECENPNAGPDGAGFRADVAYTLEARSRTQSIAYAIGSHAGCDGEVTNASHDTGGPVGMGVSEEMAPALRAGRTQAIVTAVPRRLVPIECEKLQGFPRNWTKYGRTPDGETFELKDSPRYRCLGNAVSVPVAEWIARRIMEAA